MKRDIGFGEASYGIITSLQQLGHVVPFGDPTAAVEISFFHPDWWDFSNPDAHKIGLIPWESSEIPDHWAMHMETADEIWATSEHCARALEKAGVPGPIKVYGHGIGKQWAPRKRERNGPIKFLSVGEPAERKGAQMTLDAFYEVFGKSAEEATLTIKANGYNATRIRNGQDIIYAPQDLPNMRTVVESIDEEDLIQLYYDHDVLIYPSWGEGFGFFPAQALATGMPTICTAAWAPYKDYLNELALSSEVVPTRWPNEHPGLMYKPDFEELKRLLRYTVDNFDHLSEEFYAQSQTFHDEYDWVKLTEEAFRPIVEKFG